MMKFMIMVCSGTQTLILPGTYDSMDMIEHSIEWMKAAEEYKSYTFRVVIIVE